MVIIFLMPLIIGVRTALIPFHTAVQTRLIALPTVEMMVRITCSALEITVLIALNAAKTYCLQFSHIKRNGSVIMLNAALNRLAMNIMATCMPFFIPFHIVLMKFHSVVKMFLTQFQAV